MHTSNPPDSLVLHAPDLSTLPRMAAAWLLLAHDSWPLLGELHRLPLLENCAAEAAITGLIITSMTTCSSDMRWPGHPVMLPSSSSLNLEREFFIDNLLVRGHHID